MASTKRARPAFEPPRPRKPTGNAAKTTGVSKGSGKSKASASKTVTSSKAKSKSKSKPEARRRSRLVSPTPSASDSLAEVSDDNDQDGDTTNDEGEHDNTNLEDSPEPDYILAEVTHDAEANSAPPIPLGLIHRIIHSQFTEPEKTKISTDAREVVGKYIEVFVREAIMRCAYEKTENQGGGSSGDGTGGGWLELEDLEKVAVQLCLDF